MPSGGVKGKAPLEVPRWDTNAKGDAGLRTRLFQMVQPDLRQPPAAKRPPPCYKQSSNALKKYGVS